MAKSSKSQENKLIWFVPLILSGLYLLNFTAGFDLLPDNLPIFGNLDEVAITGIFLKSLGEIKNAK